MPPEIWYRYEDKTYAGGINEDGDWDGDVILKVELRAFVVLRRTKYGVWLALTFGNYKTGDFIGTGRRFVLNRSVKRFACPTVEQAVTSFIARKRRQASIYDKRGAKALAAIEIIKHIQEHGTHKQIIL